MKLETMCSFSIPEDSERSVAARRYERYDPLTFNVPLSTSVFGVFRGQHDIRKLYDALYGGSLQRNGWRLHHIELPVILLLGIR